MITSVSSEEVAMQRTGALLPCQRAAVPAAATADVVLTQGMVERVPLSRIIGEAFHAFQLLKSAAPAVSSDGGLLRPGSGVLSFQAISPWRAQKGFPRLLILPGFPIKLALSYTFALESFFAGGMVEELVSDQGPACRTGAR